MCISPVIKLRPIISHAGHPCRPFLRRVARVLSMLVELASNVCHQARPHHLPIWRMHKGVQQWLAMLGARQDLEELLEFDVEDCFLNTPRELVLQALRYWLSFPFSRRTLQYFAISKDSKREDHIGRPCSPHYWELPVAVVSATVEWELLHNSFFAVVDGSSERQLRQTKGLPIGGHLSAALVELVALFREHTAAPWPPALAQHLSCRYRDNFFVAVDSPVACPVDVAAQELTALLRMPVKAVARGTTARLLEVRLTLARGSRVRSVLAFRTDADRQGGSGDVDSWPAPDNPRTRMLLPGLLAGLAGKLRFDTVASVGGYTATIRAMYAFVTRKHYPASWWLRPFALQLMRSGAHLACLPPALRVAVRTCQ